MVFSSPVFLFIFFPVVWFIHSFLPHKAKNGFLLFASLLFYFYGEGWFLFLMLFTIAVTYVAALVITVRPKFAFSTAFWAIVLNLGILVVFKYAGFFSSQINALVSSVGLSFPLFDIHLPVGISFFTFQAVSCIVDVYRNPSKEKPSLINTALYISFFPQLIAGPILRYNNFIPQLKNRMVHYSSFAYGLKRFVYGLSKKILIANTLAVAVDKIFLLEPASMGALLGWTGAFLFTLQIYFDFSGYSDMAIGLGRMFGLKIPENFNYPFISRSVTEFWRRWHISLSTWFRDYLYIPMGGSRKGTARTFFNLWTVFFICGLWHGAAWNFVIFGLLHGTLMVIERLFSNKNPGFPSIMRYGYTFLSVMIIFIVFRTPEISQFPEFLKAMFLFRESGIPFSSVIDIETIYALSAGVIFMFPVSRIFQDFMKKHRFAVYLESVVVLILFAMSISNNSMIFANPFIYFRF